MVSAPASHAEDRGSNPVGSRQARSPSCDWYRCHPGNYDRRISVTRFPHFGMSVILHIRRSRIPLAIGAHHVLRNHGVLICIAYVLPT